ncbi:threonine/serine exporter family protein [Mycobacterium sp.]|uniref:threonine/serine exporter family protein n=1 Tax=Mycobacterium sp. TaxID=1785 RepID=UPI0025CCEA95|nr:threonine/serine exporter family protein [Mycobacterium sp.]MBW0011830.1 threonine/serine exporter family protein [Mycobacterium sp.]
MPEASPDALAVDFMTRLGAAMAAGNYPIVLIRRALKLSSERYGLSNQILLLPNFIQFGGFGDAAGTTVRVERSETDLRYDQTFPLAALVEAAQEGRIDARDGLAELERICALTPRFPPWVNVIGYAVQSCAFALILQPTPVAMLAATGLGLMVGLLGLLGRVSNALAHLLPTISSFLVAFTAFGVERLWHDGDDSLRDLLAPLALFLPGAAITLAVVDLTTREVVSGSARLVAGFMRLAQLAFGILVAAEVLNVSSAELNAAPLNMLGPWAPWAGVVVYAFGIVLYLGPPNRFLPWLLVTVLVTYAGQVTANALFGSSAGGFGGGLALMVCALAVSQRPDAPPAAALLAPGFWLLVPGALGLVGVTQLVTTNTGAAVAVTVMSIISIALGLQTGVLLWRARRQLSGDSSSP